MVKYNVTHTTKFSYSEPVPVCHNLVHLAPRAIAHQTCHEFSLLLSPAPPYRHRRLDYFGNQVDHFSIHVAHQGLTVTAHSQVEILPSPVPDAAATPAWTELAQSRTQRCFSRGTVDLPIHVSVTVHPLGGSVRGLRATFVYSRSSGAASGNGADLADPYRFSLRSPRHDDFDVARRSVSRACGRLPRFFPSPNCVPPLAGTAGPLRQRLPEDLATRRTSSPGRR